MTGWDSTAFWRAISVRRCWNRNDCENEREDAEYKRLRHPPFFRPSNAVRDGTGAAIQEKVGPWSVWEQTEG